MQDLIDAQVEQQRLFGTAVCRAMLQTIVKTGFSVAEIDAIPRFEDAEFSLIKDPYTADLNLTGYWYDARKQRIGSIQFLSDGSFYAEYDIVKPHPVKKQWFVEAITAWGKPEQIKSEAKLLPALE